MRRGRPFAVCPLLCGVSATAFLSSELGRTAVGDIRAFLQPHLDISRCRCLGSDCLAKIGRYVFLIEYRLFVVRHSIQIRTSRA